MVFLEFLIINLEHRRQGLIIALFKLNCPIGVLRKPFQIDLDLQRLVIESNKLIVKVLVNIGSVFEKRGLSLLYWVIDFELAITALLNIPENSWRILAIVESNAFSGLISRVVVIGLQTSHVRVYQCRHLGQVQKEREIQRKISALQEIINQVLNQLDQKQRQKRS